MVETGDTPPSKKAPAESRGFCFPEVSQLTLCNLPTFY